ncbi:MAG: DUF4124 domain-containing protein [Pseudomonadota bacterium]
MTQRPLPCILGGLLLAAGLSAQAATYRWVDEQGRVHYSDTMPPQQASQGHRELDKEGRVVREVTRTQQRSTVEKRRAELERQQALERLRRDKALLSSFTTEAEIDLVRDRALELENLQINSLQARMNNASEKLSYANQEIKKFSGPGEKVPKSYLQMREEAQNELAQIGEMLRQRQQNMEQLKSKYEADKLRFRELKSSDR